MPLAPFFTTEYGLAFCGIASSVMVLNALKLPQPLTPEHAPYRIFNQDNIFNKEVTNKITPSIVLAHGATLEQIATILRIYTNNVQTSYGHEINLQQFRKLARTTINKKDEYIIVNFCRKDIDELGCGHFSPLAAYHAGNDRFLLLDVARYKYPPVWIKTNDLYKSISTGIDSASKKPRGVIIVGKANKIKTADTTNTAGTTKTTNNADTTNNVNTAATTNNVNTAATTNNVNTAATASTNNPTTAALKPK